MNVTVASVRSELRTERKKNRYLLGMQFIWLVYVVVVVAPVDRILLFYSINFPIASWYLLQSSLMIRNSEQKESWSERMCD